MSCDHLNPQNYLSSLQGKFIYKDQCTKCFADPTDEQGLDLCLKCFNGGCLANNFQHSQQHFEIFKHPLALNIKMVAKKIEQEEQQNNEITKLAIGKEGGAQVESQVQYDTFYQLKCIPCKTVLDNNKLEALIQSLEKAENSLLKANLVSWELEIQPCEHTLTIQQEPPFKLEDNKLAHCGDCDLSSNLWLCLYCGYLGCGRKYYDGSGGNNHAIDHFKQHNHPLVVKMGTITPEGKASVHCYACDEEVQDNFLAEHLNNFGIQVEKQVKTEQTIQEINLSANLNLELSKSMEEGRQLEQVFGQELTGLVNLGNSCYINSVVQSLFSINEFKQRYYKEGQHHLNNCIKFTPECFYCQISKLGLGLCSGLYSVKQTHQYYDNDKKTEVQENYQNGIKIHHFKELIGKGHQEFQTSHQQDTLEYLLHLFDLLKKNEKMNGLSDITSLFQLSRQSKVKCLNCNSFKLTEDKGVELRLNCPYVKDGHDYPVAFQDILDEYSQGSIVQDTMCSVCNKKTNSQLNLYINDFPKYLLVAIQRFVLDNWVPQKVNAYINFPQSIDLSQLIMPQPAENEKQIQQQSQDPALSVNQKALEELMNFGFGKNRSVRALIANKDNLENSLNWLFERTEDDSLDEPLEQKQQSSGGNEAPAELVEMINQMGFTDDQARYALSKCQNNIERAIEYLFNHPDEIENLDNLNQKDQSQNNKEKSLNAKYQLHACIVHLGKSVGSGHYVCYIRKNNEWIYFNDTKVSRSPEPLLGRGYLYILKQVE